MQQYISHIHGIEIRNQVDWQINTRFEQSHNNNLQYTHLCHHRHTAYDKKSIEKSPDQPDAVQFMVPAARTVSSSVYPGSSGSVFTDYFIT